MRYLGGASLILFATAGGLPTEAAAQNTNLMKFVQQKAFVSTQSKLSVVGIPTVKQKSETTGPVATPIIASGTFVALPSSVNPGSLHLGTPFAATAGGMFLNPGTPQNPSGRPK